MTIHDNRSRGLASPASHAATSADVEAQSDRLRRYTIEARVLCSEIESDDRRIASLYLTAVALPRLLGPPTRLPFPKHSGGGGGGDREDGHGALAPLALWPPAGRPAPTPAGCCLNGRAARRTSAR